ncbi:hypothetical protein Tco_0466014, partial [Tanacetum coccineum]
MDNTLICFLEKYEYMLCPQLGDRLVISVRFGLDYLCVDCFIMTAYVEVSTPYVEVLVGCDSLIHRGMRHGWFIQDQPSSLDSSTQEVDCGRRHGWFIHDQPVSLENLLCLILGGPHLFPLCNSSECSALTAVPTIIQASKKRKKIAKAPVEQSNVTKEKSRDQKSVLCGATIFLDLSLATLQQYAAIVLQHCNGLQYCHADKFWFDARDYDWWFSLILGGPHLFLLCNSSKCSALTTVPTIIQASKKRKKTAKAPVEQSNVEKEKVNIRKRLHLSKEDMDDRSEAVKKVYYRWMAHEDCAMPQFVTFKKEIFWDVNEFTLPINPTDIIELLMGEKLGTNILSLFS